MGKPLAIIASDLHLKPRTWKHRQIVGDSYHAWDQVVSGAIEYQVSYVILAGDLLDRQLNGSEPIIKLKEGLDRLEKAGITTLFIQGQHEYQESPWASLSGSIHLHGQEPVEVGPFKIFGIDYQSKEELLPAIGELPILATDRNILVMHQVWQDWMGERALPQGKFEDVLNSTPELEVLITGDLHEQRLENHQNAGGSEMTVLSPGSTCVQSIAEPLEKFFYVLRDDDGKAAFLPVVINNRPIFRYPKTLETVGDVEEALARVEDDYEVAFQLADSNKLSEDLCTPIFQYVYSHEVSSDVGRLEKRLDGRVHLFWKEIPDKSDKFIEAFAAGVSVTMKDVLRDHVEEGKTRDLAERLLVSPDPVEELLRWRREKAKQATQ
jgi:predicted phosphodiesterase